MGYHKGCIVEKGMVVRMKRRKIALAMAMMLCVGQLAGCGDAADTSGGTESSAGQTSTASSVFTGELE